MKMKLLTAVAVLAVALSATSMALADNITISVSGGSPLSLTGSGDSAAGVVYDGSSGVFTTVHVTAYGSGLLNEPDLDSTTIDVTKKAGTGAVTIDVTEFGLTTPIYNLTSAFSTTSLPVGWTVFEATYIDPTDSGATIPGDLVDKTTFAGTGSAQTSKLVSSGALYSETEVYTVTAHVKDAGGSITGGISTSTVVTPEPATLSLMGMGLLGLLGLRKKRVA